MTKSSKPQAILEEENLDETLRQFRSSNFCCVCNGIRIGNNCQNRGNCIVADYDARCESIIKMSFNGQMAILRKAFPTINVIPQDDTYCYVNFSNEKSMCCGKMRLDMLGALVEIVLSIGTFGEELIWNDAITEIIEIRPKNEKLTAETVTHLMDTVDHLSTSII